MTDDARAWIAAQEAALEALKAARDAQGAVEAAERMAAAAGWKISAAAEPESTASGWDAWMKAMKGAEAMSESVREATRVLEAVEALAAKALASADEVAADAGPTDADMRGEVDHG